MSQNYVKKLIPLCPRATIEVCVVTVNLLIHRNLRHHHWPSSPDLGPKCLHSDLALPMEYHPAAEMKNMHHKVTTLISLVHGELQGGLEATRNNTHFILFLVAFKRRKRKEKKTIMQHEGRGKNPSLFRQKPKKEWRKKKYQTSRNSKEIS